MMISILIALIVTGFAVLWIDRRRRRNSQGLVRLEDLSSVTRPVNLAAFRNLIDPREEAYLRSRLAPAAFRAIQRERMWAALEYVQRAGHNAALLVRAGQAAQLSSDPEVAAAARVLVNQAIELRMHSFLSQCNLYVRIALPGAHITGDSLAKKYQELGDSVGRLSRMQQPAYAERIAAAL